MALKNKKTIKLILVFVILICSFLAYQFIFIKPYVKISDECFDWKLPTEIKIKRYNKCSSLNLEKFTNGREIKANFVLTKPISGGGNDSFSGEPEETIVDGSKINRYKNDNRDSDSGLGNYHIDYAINYDRIPLKTEKPDGRTLMTAEFTLSTKDSTHVSDKEISDFIELTNTIMNALSTK